jgi:hypothetical protein
MYDIVRKPVEEVSLEDFAGGRPVFVVEHGESCHAPDEIIRRARRVLGESATACSATTANTSSEWCLHGVSRSFQAETSARLPTHARRTHRRPVTGLLRKLMRRPAFRHLPADRVSRDAGRTSGSRADKDVSAGDARVGHLQDDVRAAFGQASFDGSQRGRQASVTVTSARGVLPRSM